MSDYYYWNVYTEIGYFSPKREMCFSLLEDKSPEEILELVLSDDKDSNFSVWHFLRKAGVNVESLEKRALLSDKDLAKAGFYQIIPIKETGLTDGKDSNMVQVIVVKDIARTAETFPENI